MSRKCLIAVQGPLQFIAAFTAMEWYGLTKSKSAESEGVLLLYDFLTGAEQEQPLREAILALAAVKEWRRIVFISSKEMRSLLRRPQSARIDELRSQIGEGQFDELYLARNYIGLGSATLLQAYSTATRIQYGDGLGFVSNAVWDRQRHVSAKGARLNTVKCWAASAAHRIRFGRVPPPLAFDVSVLTLPVDFAGNALDGVPLLVPSREHFISVIERCNGLLPGLNRYCEELLNDIDGRCYLYLLSMYTETGFSSLENEVALYEEAIRENSPVGSTILIKLHPRTFSPVFDILRKAIEHDYTVKLVSEGRFKRIPIELWLRLIARCDVVAFLSSSSLSLSYLYGKNVICGMTDTLLEKYVYKEFAEYNKTLIAFEREALHALKAWDGSSILWKRKRVEAS